MLSVGSLCSCKLLSAWITVSITVERLIAVVQPLKVATLSTTRRARLVLVSLTLVCFVLAAFPLWTVGSEQWNGMPTCLRLDQTSYKSWLVAVVVIMTLSLPFSMLVVCTAIIMFFFSRSQHFRNGVSLIEMRSIFCASTFSASRQTAPFLTHVLSVWGPQAIHEWFRPEPLKIIGFLTVRQCHL